MYKRSARPLWNRIVSMALCECVAGNGIGKYVASIEDSLQLEGEEKEQCLKPVFTAICSETCKCSLFISLVDHFLESKDNTSALAILLDDIPVLMRRNATRPTYNVICCGCTAYPIGTIDCINAVEQSVSLTDDNERRQCLEPVFTAICCEMCDCRLLQAVVHYFVTDVNGLYATKILLNVLEVPVRRYLTMDRRNYLSKAIRNGNTTIALFLLTNGIYNGKIIRNAIEVAVERDNEQLVAVILSRIKIVSQHLFERLIVIASRLRNGFILSQLLEHHKKSSSDLHVPFEALIYATEGSCLSLVTQLVSHPDLAAALQEQGNCEDCIRACLRARHAGGEVLRLFIRMEILLRAGLEKPFLAQYLNEYEDARCGTGHAERTTWLLIGAGIDVDAQLADGSTAVDVARRRKFRNIVYQLTL